MKDNNEENEIKLDPININISIDVSSILNTFYMELINNNINNELLSKFPYELSTKIRNNLMEKYENLKKENNNLEVEKYLPNLIIFSYFDFFVVHKNNPYYLFNFREFYNKIFKIQNNNNYIENKNEIINIKNKLSECFNNLLECDFNNSINNLNEINSKLSDPKNYNLIKYQKQFLLIFDNLSHLLSKFNNNINKKILNEDILKEHMIENYLAELNLIESDLNEIENLKNFSEEEKNIFNISKNILSILEGDEIIEESYNNNINLYVMQNIFYRFYKNNYITKLSNFLEEKNNNNNIEKFIIIILKNCEKNCNEIIHLMQGQIIFTLNFFMIFILFNLNLLDNNNNYYNNEFKKTLENLKKLKIDFQTFSNFMNFYLDFDDMKKQINEYANYSIERAFEQYENDNNKEKLMNDLNIIRNYINNTQNLENEYDLMNKKMFDKFLEKEFYFEAIKIYFDINKFYIKNNSQKIKFNFISNAFDNILNETNDEIDKLIFNLFENNKNIFINFDNENKINKLKELEENIKKSEFNENKISFIEKFIDFIFNINEYKNNEDEFNKIYYNFFNYCFVNKNCPNVLWLNLLISYKNIYDIKFNDIEEDNFNSLNKIIKVEDINKVLNDLLTYKEVFITKLKSVSNFDFNEINNKFEIICEFLFDLKSNIYDNNN